MSSSRRRSRRHVKVSRAQVTAGCAVLGLLVVAGRALMGVQPTWFDVVAAAVGAAVLAVLVRLPRRRRPAQRRRRVVSAADAKRLLSGGHAPWTPPARVKPDVRKAEPKLPTSVRLLRMRLAMAEELCTVNGLMADLRAMYSAATEEPEAEQTA